MIFFFLTGSGRPKRYGSDQIHITLGKIISYNLTIFSRFTDGEYYRCRVEEEKEGRMLVHYVDYGNKERGITE